MAKKVIKKNSTLLTKDNSLLKIDSFTKEQVIGMTNRYFSPPSEAYKFDLTDDILQTTTLYANQFNRNYCIRSIVSSKITKLETDCCSYTINGLEYLKLTGKITSVMSYAFRYNNGLKEVDMPKCSTMGELMFSGCSRLSKIYMPQVTRISRGAFQQCAFTHYDLDMFPIATYIGEYGFYSNTLMTYANLEKITTLSNYVFQSCSALEKVIMKDLTEMRTSCFSGNTNLKLVDFRQRTLTTIPSLSTGNFNVHAEDFKIVVPDSLYDAWIVANNWSALAQYIVKASEYVEV